MGYPEQFLILATVAAALVALRSQRSQRWIFWTVVVGGAALFVAGVIWNYLA
jgi:hypothetical protein